MKLLATLVLILIVAGLVYFLGPRVPVDTRVSFDPDAVGEDPQAYVAAIESRFTGIRPGTEREIVWRDPQQRSRTPLTIVYVHGFSASKGEVRPVPDDVARALGANLYFARLAGHGLDGEALGEASVNDWINDYAEAIEIGRRIGERVVVMATSTGAALASWSAATDTLTDDVAGMVLISPNYAVRAGGAWLLTQPWGGPIANLVAGAERGFTPLNDQHARLWTTRYPTRATLPMAALADLARRSDETRARIPALFVYSPSDAVVRTDLAAEKAAGWGAPAQTILVEDSDDPGNHVIAGDAISPSTNERLTAEITAWIETLQP